MSIYWVATDGDDGNAGSEALPFATYQAAEAVAAAGDTVRYKPGAYTLGTTTIAKALNVLGPNAGVQPSDPQDITKVNSARGAEAAMTLASSIAITAPDVTVDGFSWTGPGGDVPIFELDSLYDVTGVSITNNTFSKTTAVASGSTNVASLGVADFTFSHNRVAYTSADSYYAAVNFHGGTGSTEVRSNFTFEYNYFDSTAPSPSDDAVGCISVVGCDGLYARHNYFLRGGSHFYVASNGPAGATNSYFEDNVIKNPTSAGAGCCGNSWTGVHPNGSMFFRRNEITCDVAINGRWTTQDRYMYRYFKVADTDQLVIEDNSFEYTGRYPDTDASGLDATYGLKAIVLEGDDFTTVDIKNNVIGAATETLESAGIDFSVCTFGNTGIELNTDDASYGKLTGAFTIEGNRFVSMTNAIIAFDELAGVLGGVDVAATIVVQDNSFEGSDYGVNSGAGANIDARECNWGGGGSNANAVWSNTGHQTSSGRAAYVRGDSAEAAGVWGRKATGPNSDGGIVDPVTGVLANVLKAAKVSTAVRFDPSKTPAQEVHCIKRGRSSWADLNAV